MDADALKGECQRRHADPAQAAGAGGAEGTLGGQQQPGQPDRAAQDVVVLEVAHHEAAVGERQRPDRRAEAVRAERPGVQIEAQRRDDVVERARDAVRQRHLQQRQQGRLERREQAELAVREDRVAAEDDRGPERQPPGLQLVGRPEGQRVVEGGGVTPEEDRAAAQAGIEDSAAEADQEQERQETEQGGTRGREHARQRPAGRRHARPTVRGDNQRWAPSSGRRARSPATVAPPHPPGQGFSTCQHANVPHGTALTDRIVELLRY